MKKFIEGISPLMGRKTLRNTSRNKPPPVNHAKSKKQRIEMQLKKLAPVEARQWWDQ